MGTWLATIRFPDGTSKYARYSTVVEAVLSELYPSHRPAYGRDAVDARSWHAVFDPGRH